MSIYLNQFRLCTDMWILSVAVEALHAAGRQSCLQFEENVNVRILVPRDRSDQFRSLSSVHDQAVREPIRSVLPLVLTAHDTEKMIVFHGDDRDVKWVADHNLLLHFAFEHMDAARKLNVIDVRLPVKCTLFKYLLPYYNHLKSVGICI